MALCVSFGTPRAVAVPTVADSMATDTLRVTELMELNVTSASPHRPVSGVRGGGVLTLTASSLSALPSFMGNNDPLRVMQAMPAVRSNSEFVSGLYVQGCDNSSNAFIVDGAKVINPMHMLGLFSTFNTPHFRSFRLTPVAVDASAQTATGAVVEAVSGTEPDTTLSGSATVGIIDTHATVRIPLRRGRSSLTLSGRATYVNLLFGSALRIDHASLGYDFDDWNATYVHSLGDEAGLKASVCYGGDRMTLDDRYYDSRGRFAWHNIAASASYFYRRWHHTVSYSGYRNRFLLTQGSSEVTLPSAFATAAYSGKASFGLWNVALNYTAAMERRQQSGVDDALVSPAAVSTAHHVEAGVDRGFGLADRVEIGAAMRMALFRGRGGYTRAYPMPGVRLAVDCAPWMKITARWGMYVQFTHQVRESAVGMPSDFWINASRRFAPMRSRAATLTVSGSLLDNLLDYSVEGYYRRIYNELIYQGALLNVVNRCYDPLDDVRPTRGYACGLSVTLMKNYGRLRGWLSYNIGRSRRRNSEISDGWFAADHDRLHDFNAVVSADIVKGLAASLTATYATGYPTTEASYGYMIGENLIVEYEPYNSSRLPDYFRIDLSASYRFRRHGRFGHSIELSVYNVLARENVLFSYVTYTAAHGLQHKRTGLRMPIPSLSYTITF